jgi:hypothetical protein
MAKKKKLTAFKKKKLTEWEKLPAPMRGSSASAVARALGVMLDVMMFYPVTQALCMPQHGVHCPPMLNPSPLAPFALRPSTTLRSPLILSERSPHRVRMASDTPVVPALGELSWLSRRVPHQRRLAPSRTSVGLGKAQCS